MDSIWNDHGMIMDWSWNGQFHMESITIPHGFHGQVHMDSMEQVHMDSMEQVHMESMEQLQMELMTITFTVSLLF